MEPLPPFFRIILVRRTCKGCSRLEAILGGIILVVILFLVAKIADASNSAPPSEDAPEPLKPLDLPKPRNAPKIAPRRPPPRILTGTAWVIDGDTIVIDRVHLRLFGIDAPELDHPYGQKAKSAMIGLCKGHKVRAEIRENDHYDRCVARCFLPDGRDLSAELVKMGLAIDWPKYSGGVYRKLETQDVRRRLWRAHNRQMGWPVT